MDTVNDRVWAYSISRHLTGRAVTIDGQLWAYRMYSPTGRFEQWSADAQNIRARWYGDVMQYFAPIERGGVCETCGAGKEL